MKPVLLLAAFASFAFAASPAADAATASKTFQVTAEIAPFCAVNVSDLNFGSYTTANINGGIPLDATSGISVICPDETPYTIGLDGGLNSPLAELACEPNAPTDLSRSMKSTTPPNFGSLGYSLYSDAARTVPWGCNEASDVAGIGNGSTFDQYTVYGRIPAGSVTLADTYADTVTVTVTF